MTKLTFTNETKLTVEALLTFADLTLYERMQGTSMDYYEGFADCLEAMALKWYNMGGDFANSQAID